MTEVNTTELTEELIELFNEITKALTAPTADSFRSVSMKLAELSGVFAFASGFLTGLDEAREAVKEITKED